MRVEREKRPQPFFGGKGHGAGAGDPDLSNNLLRFEGSVMRVHSTQVAQRHISLTQLCSHHYNNKKTCLELTEIDQLVPPASLLPKPTYIQISEATDSGKNKFSPSFLRVKDATKTGYKGIEKELKSLRNLRVKYLFHNTF